MAVALTAGMVLARRKRFRAHAWTQSAMLLLNLVAIGGVMWPSFRRQVMPRVPGAWNDPSQVVPLVHATVGSVAELLGLYVILVAGTRMVPRSLRFRNYKAWMRTTLALWWMVVALGVGVYGLWYVQGSQAALLGAAPPTPSGATAPSGARRVAVTATNFAFAPKQITVPVGATVEWVVDEGRHQVVADDGSFRSAVLTSGAKFQQRFTKAGTYAYHCEFHGDVGGKGMAGTIVVK